MGVQRPKPQKLVSHINRPKTLQEAKEFSEYIKGMEELRNPSERPLCRLEMNRRKGKRKSVHRIVSEVKHSVKKRIDYRYSIRHSYDFLQYTKLIMAWGQEKIGCTKNQLELFLYIYPLGLFTKKDLLFCSKQLNMSSGSIRIDALERKGFLYKIDPVLQGAIQKANVYELSRSVKTIISKMHKICAGEMPLPKIEKFPDLLDSQKVIDDFYVTIHEKLE